MPGLFTSHSTETKRFVLYSLIVLVIFTIVFWSFAVALEEHALHHFDLAIITWIQSFISAKVTIVAKLFTFMGSAMGVVCVGAVTIIAMLLNRKWWETAYFIVAVLGSSVFNLSLKWIFHRARPTIHPIITETGYSFPSGHSMSSIVLYGMIMFFLVLFFKRRLAKILTIVLFSLLILFIGISRIYLGVHYPSDVIAGFSAGGTWLFICIIMLKLIVDKRSNGDHKKR